MQAAIARTQPPEPVKEYVHCIEMQEIEFMKCLHKIEQHFSAWSEERMTRYELEDAKTWLHSMTAPPPVPPEFPEAKISKTILPQPVVERVQLSLRNRNTAKVKFTQAKQDALTAIVERLDSMKSGQFSKDVCREINLKRK